MGYSAARVRIRLNATAAATVPTTPNADDHEHRCDDTPAGRGQGVIPVADRGHRVHRGQRPPQRVWVGGDVGNVRGSLGVEHGGGPDDGERERRTAGGDHDALGTPTLGDHHEPREGCDDSQDPQRGHRDGGEIEGMGLNPAPPLAARREQ